MLEKGSIQTTTGKTFSQKIASLVGAQINHPPIHTLKEILQIGSPFRYWKDYYKIFSPDLWISKNFAQTSNSGLLPVFSPLQKKAKQILILRQKDGLKAVLLSSLEGHFFKKYLSKKDNKAKQVLILRQKDGLKAVLPSSLEGHFLKQYLSRKDKTEMWLVLPNGRSYVKNPPKMTQKEIKELDRLLWEVNVFNGNIEALLENDNTPTYRASINPSLLSDFLKLKIESEPSQRALFYNHFLVS